MKKFEDLLGKTLGNVERVSNFGEDEIVFTLDDGKRYKLHHVQDCCESVYVESIEGDLADLIGSPILIAEEASGPMADAYDSGTWTFYKLATVKGYVDIRWNGKSNGYYSESVYFSEVSACS